eukprot:UC1_evm1s177
MADNSVDVTTSAVADSTATATNVTVRIASTDSVGARDGIIHQGVVTVNSRRPKEASAKLKLTNEELLVVPTPSAHKSKNTAFILALSDVIGARLVGPDLGDKCMSFCVHALPPAKDGSRTLKAASFTCSSRAAAEEWVCALRCALVGAPVTDGEPPARRLLVLVNPLSGTKKAHGIYERKVLPLLELAHVAVTLQMTEYAGHARDIAAELDLSAFDVVACVSGDGLFSEVTQGLVSRQDWRKALRMPLAIIPAGSGN